jgi:hypothetical protein
MPEEKPEDYHDMVRALADEEDSVLDASSTEPQPVPGAGSQPGQSAIDRLAEKRKKAAPVDRTKLDVDAVREMASKSVSQQEEKIREQIESRPPEPFKPFQAIEKYKSATACSSDWDRMKGTGCVKFCEQCKLQVYDFSKTEMPEVESTIFKTEGKKNFVLYKRSDGKFLTSDCPVGVKRKQTILVASICGVLVVAGFLWFVSTMPPPPPPAKNAASLQQIAPSNQTNVQQAAGSGQVESLRKRRKHSFESAFPSTTAPTGEPQQQTSETQAPQGQQQLYSVRSPDSAQPPGQPAVPGMPGTTGQSAPSGAVPEASTQQAAPVLNQPAPQNAPQSLPVAAPQSNGAAVPEEAAPDSQSTQRPGIWEAPRQ